MIKGLIIAFVVVLLLSVGTNLLGLIMEKVYKRKMAEKAKEKYFNDAD